MREARGNALGLAGIWGAFALVVAIIGQPHLSFVLATIAAGFIVVYLVFTVLSRQMSHTLDEIDAALNGRVIEVKAEKPPEPSVLTIEDGKRHRWTR